MSDTGHKGKSQNEHDGPGDHRPVGQPHSEAESPIAEADRAAARIRSDEYPLGPRGQRFDRRSPFYLGLAASAGVAVTYGAVCGLASISSVLVLIGVSFFFALGLEPAISALVNRKLPRWAAVTLVTVIVFAIIIGMVAAAVPPLAEQARQFVEQAPRYLQQLQDHSSLIGRLNDRFHLQQHITEALTGSGGAPLSGLVKAGSAVLGALADLGIVAVLTVYTLVDMARIRATLYRFVPRSRRPRAILLGDEVLAKVGAFVLGNVATSLIAGIATFAWCIVLDVPYSLLLGAFVAILDLLPYGSTVAGIVVAAVALTVSIPVSVATVAFYILFRWFEDYLLVPKVIGRAVAVPAGVTVVAVLIGAALLGIVGALIAIPVAAALQLLTQEVLFPALDEA
ncbi:MAG: AI-2E family transporter [Mycobacterium sp.]|nr:AI-2E family transporter [Mycobacterium sp.]